MAFRVIAGVLGAFFLVQGVNWLIAPYDAAGALGMLLLDELGRSTQIGDLASFFICLGGFAMYGAYARNPSFLRASGCLVGLVAVTRTIAWAFHGAAFTALFIAVEVIAGAAFFFLATRVGAPAPE